MIFAAGLGTRLKPLTDTMPKALVPVGGRPLIEHVCRKLKESDIHEAVVNVHHFADMIEDWAEKQDIVDVDISDERNCLLETGGAVLHARPYLEGCGCFLIHNVDILSNLDIRWLAAKVRGNALATLLVSKRESSRRLLFDPDTMSLVGWHNLQTGQVRTPFPDLNPEDCLSLAFSGIHIMSDAIFPVLEKYAQTRGLCMSSLPPRFPVIDFYLWACSCHDIYGVCAEDLELIDVGKLDSLETAEKILQRLRQ